MIAFPLVVGQVDQVGRSQAVPSRFDHRIKCGLAGSSSSTYPRVTVRFLRRSQIAVTMDIYAQVAAASTRAALPKLGKALVPESTTEHDAPLLRNIAANNDQRPFPELGMGL